jgi:tetratricopeptide (TPR) repeat protein
MMDRSNFINLIRNAMIANRLDFARSMAADWLSLWPNDVEFIWLLAKSEVEDGMHQKAIQRLLGLIEIDPEFSEAYKLLYSAYSAIADKHRATIHKTIFYLLQRLELGEDGIPSWIRALDRALEALEKGNHRRAISQSLRAMESDPGFTLPTLILVKAYSAADKTEEALSYARYGHDRWPECLYFRILIARDLIHQGEIAYGVEQLHKIASDDPAGQIVQKVLGRDHPYRSLWPEHLAGTISRPIPAEIAALMGHNRLSNQSSIPSMDLQTAESPHLSDRKMPKIHHEEHGGIHLGDRPPPPPDSIERSEETEAVIEPKEEEPYSIDNDDEDEWFRIAEREFKEIADRLKIPLPKEKGQVQIPSYVILSSKTRLMDIFGEEKFKRIDEAILHLIEAVRKRPGWNAYRLYIEDPTTLEHFGLTPAEPFNPWEIKLRLTDLDQFLKDRDEMIGSLLIIGGHEIIPFHMLPNPTDDDDEVIPSDNPYATTDSNYFAPEWPVGRLPSDSDVDLLVRLVRSYAQEHQYLARQETFIRRFTWRIINILRLLLRSRQSSIGYSASIWRKASLAVFRTIGNPRSLLTSPPVEAETLPPQAIKPSDFSYYNLHGLEDSPEWFGQRDPFEDEPGTVDFPIALRPQDIVNGGRAPQVVFTEACYGANVLQKTSNTAICLRFLDQGSKGVIGSTKISYGSVTPPLIAADLLGRLFWEGLKVGMPTGEALRQAKLKLATEMHRRQGYLDGEDQKTLISFVLYGDPLYCTNNEEKQKNYKEIIRKSTRPTQMKTACALGGPVLDPDDLEPIMLSKVRSIVSSYLPGMSDAVCRIHPQRHSCNGTDHMCPTHQLSMNKVPPGAQSTLVVTLSKHVPDGQRHHPHFARLTLDENGKILKLAVSR